MSSREVEGHVIVTSGSLVCPSSDLCDIQKGRGGASETYAEYVHRHCGDHLLGDFQGATEDAERNLSLNCFYFDHKYVWGNPSLTPLPFWEIHAFVSEWTWNEEDLEERVKLSEKTFAPIPPAHLRRPGDYRDMKQLELPRQLQKTTIGARAYPLFESKREYFINDERNYPIMIRSATTLNSRDSLLKIFKRATTSPRIKRIFGVDLVKCVKCGESSHIAKSAPRACPVCGETKKVRIQAISLVDPTRGAGGTSKDSITFRWGTKPGDDVFLPIDDPNYNPFGGGDEDDEDGEEENSGDDDSPYSVRAVGLKTELTGQRPRLYILDDITTADNSKTSEMRGVIHGRFDQATMQLEFGGRLLVNNTRKFVDDFPGKISVEPLRSQFHTLHRRVYWESTETECLPYVVGGYRYYYPEKGNGKPALDAKKVAELEKRSDFSSEYLNDPTDPKKALFKRSHFPILDVTDPAVYDRIPIEIRYGLGREVTKQEELELSNLNLTIRALNFWDPAGKEGQSKRGDDTFGVGMRVDRYGAIYITWLAAGQWSATKTWDEVARGNAYNRPRWNDYEMGVDEKNVRPSFQKWQRDVGERTGVTPDLVLQLSHMPKSTKTGRIELMETWTSNGNFYILSNAADSTLIEKYVGQWLGYLVTGHDDGPDATSRCVKHLRTYTYQAPAKAEDEAAPQTLTGGLSWAALKAMGHKSTGKSWGDLR